MTDSLDVFCYMSYVRLRWRVVAGSCAAAVLLTLGISMALTREYTATARIVIEPPAGADPRSAMAVSPIYLESLKTYEEFAGSDSLFEKAAGRFGLRQLVGARSIEGLKSRVLRVGIVRNTRILEIAATLPVAGRAQALAQFLAEQTVALNQSLITRGGNDLLQTLEQQAQEARARLDGTDKSWSELLASEPVDDLQNEIFQAGQLRAELNDRLANLRLDAADSSNSGEEETAQARLKELQRQLETLNRDTSEREKLLAGRVARKERLEAQRKADQAAVASLEQRLRDTRNDLSYRGERLTIIDPGVIPERPSSPNVPLNVSAALLLGLLLPLAYLAFDLSYRQYVGRSRMGVVRELARMRHE